MLSQTIQVALTLAAGVVLLMPGFRARLPSVALVWSVWLLAPLVRRLLGLVFGPSELDVLSLTPFLLTALAVIVHLPRLRPTSTALLVVGLAVAGFAIGIPAGLSDPARLAFAMLAYYAALSAAALGFVDGTSDSRPSLALTFVLFSVPLAAYAMVQYWFAPLVPWDTAWLATSDLASWRAPELAHIRVFGTLNSYVPFAVVLATTLLITIRGVNSGPLAAVVASMTAIALALTFVRSAWVALVVALVVLVLADRRRELLFRLAGVAIVGAVLIGVGWGHPTVQAVVARAVTLSAVSQDVSAGARIEQVRETIPGAVGTSLGHGLGQRGLALRLGGEQAAATADNGYLALLYQTGPLGFLAMALAIGSSGLLALLAVARRIPGASLDLAILTLMAVMQIFTDMLYGVAGVILWYTVGHVLAHAPPLGSLVPARWARPKQAAV